MEIKGQLKDAQLEVFTTAARPVAGKPGRVIFDTDLGIDLIDNGSVWLQRPKSGFKPGLIEDFHTYNGTVPIPAGSFPCDGSVINEANYDAVHGAGSWDSDVVSSLLDGKRSPNLIGKYTVGAAATPADGSVAIPVVGNTSHQINIDHSHIVNSHAHKWFQAGDSYNVSGGLTAVEPISIGSGLNIAFRTTSSNSYYTNAQSPGTDSKLSSTQSVQPESVETIKIIRII